MTVKKALKKTIALPLGRISYPFLAKADEGREYSDGAWKFDYLVPSETWKKEGKRVTEAILEVARDLTGNPKLKYEEIKKHPIKDLSLDPKVDPKMKDYVMMRCKNKNNQPLIVDINKKEMSQEAITKIKGGDWCEAIVTVYSYSQSGGGVTFGLDVVRFVKEGESFGSGAAKHLGLLDDIEVTAEGFSDEEVAALAGAK